MKRLNFIIPGMSKERTNEQKYKRTDEQMNGSLTCSAKLDFKIFKAEAKFVKLKNENKSGII